MQIAFAINILTQLLGLVPAATAAWGMIQTSRNKLEQMRAENRDPTPQEWADLNSQTTSLLAQLNAPKP